MRGRIWAVLTAAVIIAVMAAWRITENTERRLVDEAALPGSWVRIGMENCNPALPARLTLRADGGYRTLDATGTWTRDSDGRYELREGSFDYPLRIFRAEEDRLELLNRLGCKAAYARSETG